MAMIGTCLPEFLRWRELRGRFQAVHFRHLNVHEDSNQYLHSSASNASFPALYMYLTERGPILFEKSGEPPSDDDVILG